MLIIDCETKTPTGRPDPTQDIIRAIGFYDLDENKEYFMTYLQKDEIIALIKKHRVIITFNGDYYDIPILQRHGMWGFGHISVDLRVVLKKRATFLGASNISFSLLAAAKFFKLESKKIEDFDYSILGKDSWTDEELAYIKEYTMQDIMVTKQLFEKFDEFFSPFKEGLSKIDIMKMKWMTTTMSVYGYKVLCNMVGIPEEYADTYERDRYDGGFVAEPIVDEAHDDVYCLDFASLYPHNNIQSNLFSHNCKCCTKEEKWHGNKLFPVLGYYCKKQHGKIEQALIKLYKRRDEYKKAKDPREYAIKIVLNSIYGMTANPVFKQVYNYNTASDCTLIGRESIKYAREQFDKAGYTVLYSDTDSVYLQDPFKNKERILQTKNKIIKHLQDNLPLPVFTFDMKVDAEIAHIWFFKTEDTFKKKQYMYVTTNGKLRLIGMTMTKRDSSGLGLYIFNKYMREQVLTGNIHFNFEHIHQKIYEELEKNPLLAARQFKVLEPTAYKKEHQIQKCIAKVYGSGTHKLIPNKHVGVGKSIKYCTEKEFKNARLGPHSIILNKTWNELKPFLNKIPKEISACAGKNQKELLKWTNI